MNQILPHIASGTLQPPKLLEPWTGSLSSALSSFPSILTSSLRTLLSTPANTGLCLATVLLLVFLASRYRHLLNTYYRALENYHATRDALFKAYPVHDDAWRAATLAQARAEYTRFANELGQTVARLRAARSVEELLAALETSLGMSAPDTKEQIVDGSPVKSPCKVAGTPIKLAGTPVKAVRSPSKLDGTPARSAGTPGKPFSTPLRKASSTTVRTPGATPVLRSISSSTARSLSSVASSSKSTSSPRCQPKTPSSIPTSSPYRDLQPLPFADADDLDDLPAPPASSLAGAQAEIRRLSAALGRARRAKRRLERQLNKRECELYAAAEELERVEGELERAEGELADAQKELADAHQEIDESYADLEGAYRDLEDAQNDARDLRCALFVSDTELAGLKSRVEELEGLGARFDRQQAQLNKQKAQLDKQKAQLEELRARDRQQRFLLGCYSSDLAAARKKRVQLGELEARVRELEGENGALRREVGELRGEVQPEVDVTNSTEGDVDKSSPESSAFSPGHASMPSTSSTASSALSTTSTSSSLPASPASLCTTLSSPPMSPTVALPPTFGSSFSCSTPQSQRSGSAPQLQAVCMASQPQLSCSAPQPQPSAPSSSLSLPLSPASIPLPASPAPSSALLPRTSSNPSLRKRQGPPSDADVDEREWKRRREGEAVATDEVDEEVEQAKVEREVNAAQDVHVAQARDGHEAEAQLEAAANQEVELPLDS